MPVVCEMCDLKGMGVFPPLLRQILSFCRVSNVNKKFVCFYFVKACKNFIRKFPAVADSVI